MYVSIRDDILPAAGYPDVLAGLQDLGLGAVELAVDRDYNVKSLVPGEERPTIDLSTNDGVDILGDQVAAADIRVSAFLLPNNFNAPDIDGELEWIVRIVHVADHLGVPAVRIDAIMSGERDLPREERERIFARGVQHVLDNTSDVALGIENHGFQGNDPEFIERTLALIDSDRLGVTLDSGNFYWAGHPLDTVHEILERLAPFTKHTHIKNIRYPEHLRNTRRELGWEYGQYVSPITEGDIDHARVVDALRRAGYQGDLCLEDESLGKYDVPTRRANLRRAVEFFRRLGISA